MENDIFLSFVIVNYRSQTYLAHCIDSISRNKFDFTYEIIVVNNDRNPLRLSFTMNHLSVIEQHQNTGFASSCNTGAKQAKGEIIWFLNPDTEILPHQDIHPLLALLIQKRFSIIGPKLIEKQGSSVPQEWSAGIKTGLWDIVKNNLGIVASRKYWESSKLIGTDWVSGASLFARKDDFFKIGGFDESFFLYFEDIDLCVRMKQQRKQVGYFPDYSVVHFSGKSSSSHSLQKKEYFRSQSYYLKKHSGALVCLFALMMRKLHSKLFL